MSISKNGATIMQKLKLSTRPERQRRVLAVHDISCVGRCSLTVGAAGAVGDGV